MKGKAVTAAAIRGVREARLRMRRAVACGEVAWSSVVAPVARRRRSSVRGKPRGDCMDGAADRDAPARRRACGNREPVLPCRRIGLRTSSRWPSRRARLNNAESERLRPARWAAKPLSRLWSCTLASGRCASAAVARDAMRSRADRCGKASSRSVVGSRVQARRGGARARPRRVGLLAGPEAGGSAVVARGARTHRACQEGAAGGCASAQIVIGPPCSVLSSRSPPNPTRSQPQFRCHR